MKEIMFTWSLLSLKGYMKRIENVKSCKKFYNHGRRVSTLNVLVRGKAFSS